MTAPVDTHAHGDPLGIFSESEREAFHASDRSAGAAIVLEVSGIFTIGVVIYLIVLYSCM